jgi:hypothetical protein
VALFYVSESDATIATRTTELGDSAANTIVQVISAQLSRNITEYNCRTTMLQGMLVDDCPLLYSISSSTRRYANCHYL